MTDNTYKKLVLRLFRQRMDTVDISKTLRIPEHEAASLLAQAREEDREFDNYPSVSTIHQPFVEDGKR